MNFRQLVLGLHISFWAVTTLTYLSVIARVHGPALGLLRTGVNLVLIAGLVYVNSILLTKFLENKRILAFAFWGFINYIFFSILRYIGNSSFPIPYQNPYWDNKTALLTGAFLANALFWLISIFYHMLINRLKNEQKALALLEAQHEAQLQLLKAQLNPHFLFNTLNNIYSLAVARSPKTASMVLKLSNLLRYVTYDSQAERISLSKEIEQVKQFIDLFQMSKESPLNITLSVTGDAETYVVEPMLMIPLIENGLKHTDFHSNPDAFLSIAIEIGENELTLTTLNSKDDRYVQKDKTGGVGLENIRRRLDLRYGSDDLLKIQSGEKQFEVSLRIPLDVSLFPLNLEEAYVQDKSFARG